MPLPAESRRRVRFGEFELDLQTRELRKDGRTFSLQEKPFQVLALLLARPGQLVTRDELRECLWSSDTFVDFDQSLNKAVNRLREALQDPAAESRLIETLTGRGYRFIAPVEATFKSIGDSSNGVPQTKANCREEEGQNGFRLPRAEQASVDAGDDVAKAESQTVTNLTHSTRTLKQVQGVIGGRAQTRRLGKREMLVWGCAMAGFAAAITMLYFLVARGPAPVIRSLIAPPEGTGFSSTLGYNTTVPAVSPDGKMLAFSATGPDNTPMIWVRPLDSEKSRPLPGTERGIGPFWSPDSKSIGFFASSKLKAVGLNNDNPVVVCDVPSGARGGSWGTGGTILFAEGPRTPISRVSSKGGSPSAVTKIDESRHGSHRWPFMLPDGRHFLYLAVNFLVPMHEDDGIYYASLDGKENRLLLKAHRSAEYASGRLLYVRDGTLLAQRFAPASGKLDGEPYPVAEKVAEDAAVWKSVISVSLNGILTYAPADAVHDVHLAWFDRNGRQLSTLGDGLKGQLYRPFRLSPAGDHLAVGIDAGITDVWVVDLAQRGLVRLTFQKNSIMPVWSPDGKWVAFLSYTGRWGISRKHSDGSGEEQTLLENAEATWPLAWSPDGTCLLYARRDRGRYQIWTLPLAVTRKPVQVAMTGDRASAAFSPDGRWVVYTSNESGKAEIYLTGFDRGQGKWQVSRDGGENPVWAAGTNEIFYLAPDNIVTVVSVKEEQGSLRIGIPRRLFRIPGAGYFDVPARGERILVGIAGVPNTKPVHMIVNWTRDLRE